MAGLAPTPASASLLAGEGNGLLARLAGLERDLSRAQSDIERLYERTKDLGERRLRIDALERGVNKCAESLDDLTKRLEDRAEQRRQERRSDRRWNIGTALAVVGIVLAALERLAG